MRTIDSIYSEYCKRHEDAECKEQIQGKTTSWDLGSLLIKPVQRVLKYPLLLKEILSLTSTEDKGYNELFAAVKGIQEVADNINEIKRRKDIVEKIVGEKRRTDINFTRRAQRLKQATGFAVEPTYDSQFETLNSKFEEQQEYIRQFARDVQGWVRHVKTTFENLQQLACSMESFYSSWGGVQVKCLTHISDFNRMASRLSTKLSRELDNNIRGYIYSRIDEFLKVFENPAQVIHKRSMKMIDYDRVRDMKLKGDIPDKALQESADAYVSINAQLVEELPIFFGLTKKFFDILISELALVQIKFYKLMQKEWRNLIEQYLGLQAADSFDEILIHHVQEMDKVEEIASQITILNRNRYAASSRSNSSNSTTMLKQRSKDTYSSSRSINTDNEMTFSSYFGQTSNSFQPTEEPENLINLEDYDTVMVPISTTDDFNCIVLYDFETHEEDVLDVKKGTILRISQDKDFIDPDWWYGTTLDDSRSGWVPINYCKKL
ncbi:uncharacterized protein BX663DRAFT_580985 [Cokeromyces recurvatus]|uniref:uncharacterized protein n=1 Tax=Cokeromyces recurvatus TaxID=90255 RepID=UPI002220DAA7|nr:uncharacterized protein BX663DRAFT_580985 [Cokeromyces recurvatus]KAI7905910.1 hypothetical protein BX663DRAFT_580985 [Cokeromyces recurvatus]